MWGSKDDTHLKADGTPDLRFKENQGASKEEETDDLLSRIIMLPIRWLLSLVGIKI